MSVFVDVVVGQLEFLKGQRLSSQLAAGQRRVRVPVDLPAGVRWVRFTGDHPRRPVIGVAVAFAVDRDDIEQNGVFGVDVNSGAAEAHPQCREHSPVVTVHCALVNADDTRHSTVRHSCVIPSKTAFSLTPPTAVDRQ